VEDTGYDKGLKIRSRRLTAMSHIIQHCTEAAFKVGDWRHYCDSDDLLGRRARFDRRAARDS
jgi:hypothetical protein